MVGNCGHPSKKLLFKLEPFQLGGIVLKHPHTKGGVISIPLEKWVFGRQAFLFGGLLWTFADGRNPPGMYKTL